MTENKVSSRIKSESNDVLLEYQRYGRNKGTIINHTYINSGEYRNKFNRITDNVEINRILYSKAKEMLNHRSGTNIEDMYWIDSKTGNVVANLIDQSDKIVGYIQYSKTVKKAISGRKDLITMHTHPQSMPPSVADFNSAFYNRYLIALVICHDGKIFRYQANEAINEKLYILYIQKFVADGYSEYEAQWNALQILKKNNGIDFWEILP